MALVTKRFYKVLRLAVAIVVVTTLFITCSHYIYDNGISVSEYKDYLQSYMDYTGSSGESNEKQPNLINNKNNDKNNALTKDKKLTNSDKLVADTLSNAAKAEELTKTQHFFDQIFQNIIDFSPKGKCSRKYKENCKLAGRIGSNTDDYSRFNQLSYDVLANCLELTPEELNDLSVSHKNYVESLGVTLPSGTYKGSGIVTVGGGRFSLMAFLIIKNLRNIGSKLPVEVFIPPNEKPELEFCNNLLPQYNAKCIYIDTILSPNMIKKFDFKGYQFKSLAMVASSFENLLLLDADNFPAKLIDNIFNEEPFKSRGLVLWPDYWRRTTTPYYYQIAEIPIDIHSRVRNSYDDLTPPAVYTKDMKDLSQVPFHDLKGTIPDTSTESGQLLISKSKHLGTMLLSLYYNVNGPNWYYPMFTQKSDGEGDKETFIAAATFYGLPYYQVKSGTNVDGYFDDSGFHGVAMLQYDFIQDYKLYELATSDIDIKYGLSNKKKHTPIKYDPEYSLTDFVKYFETDTNHDTMFIHSNFPKFDPVDLFQKKMLIDKDGNHFRGYTGLQKFGRFDIELANFKTFQEFFCQGERVSYFPYMDEALQQSSTGWEDMCKYIDDRVKHLEETHEAAVNKKD